MWKYYLWKLDYEQNDVVDMYNWYEVYSLVDLEIDDALTLGVI